jgi:hypothetical protein
MTVKPLSFCLISPRLKYLVIITLVMAVDKSGRDVQSTSRPRLVVN